MKANECLGHNWKCVALILLSFQIKGPSEGSVYTVRATVEDHKKPAIVDKGD